MSPSILQLQSVGLQDVYLTKDPQINIFKYTYYRYVNFSTDIVKLQLNEVASFGRRITCDIPKRGHLLSKLYLHLRLPKLTKVDGDYLSWSDTIGYSIFSEPIELQVNGIIIDKLYPHFMDAWDELTSIDPGKKLMILKSDLYNSTSHNAEKEIDLMIPLDFWFTKQYSSALPLLSMLGQDIRLNFKFKEFSKIINYNGSEPPHIDILDSNIYAEYVFLDDVISEQFQKQKHTYIIEQVQHNGEESISSNVTDFNKLIKFNHPTKELIFFCVEKANVDNNNYFVYSRNTDELPFISEAALLLDGKYRIEYLPEFYYRTIVPHSVHSHIPMKYIYTISFSIKPEDNQPTGSINLSRFDDVTLALRMKSGNPDCFIYVYGISYNVLTIENGNFNLEFIV